MGHLLSSLGTGPTKAKVEAVVHARRPESVSEVRTFLGPVNYYGKLISELATVAEIKLTRQKESFVLKYEQEHSFNKLKEKLTNAKTLGYFDLKAKTAIIADASLLASESYSCKRKKVSLEFFVMLVKSVRC